MRTGSNIRKRIQCLARAWPLLALWASSMPGAHAQVYKWIDDAGVVNYSNSVPSAAKNVTVVEDRVSTYTPDAALVEALQHAREQRRATPAVSTRPEMASDRVSRIAPVPPPAPVIAVDPCAVYPNADCAAVYAPIFAGRRRAPDLVQPQLTPGAIAGNVNGANAYTPGLSTFAPAATPAGAPVNRGASFTLRPRDERSPRWR
jgi:hypothetical protein